MPRIVIPHSIWSDLVKAAFETKEQGGPLRAFFLYSLRRTRFTVTRYKEVPVKFVKQDSPSGLIFRWDYPKQEHSIYYPKDGPDRYAGTLLIKPDLSMSLHYAFFMGVDFPGGSGGFNINLWVDDDGKPMWKAYYVNRDETNGEFIEIPLDISSNRE